MADNQKLPYRELETERLFFRKLEEKDIPALFELRSNPDLMRFIPRPMAKEQKDAEDLLNMIRDTVDKGEGVHWGMYLKGEDTCIGGIGFYRVEKENFRGEIGYMLHPDYHRRGLMRETIPLFLKFAFEDLNFNSVCAMVHPDNVASIRLVESFGFSREGHLRENIYFNDAFEDTVIFGLLKKEWEGGH
ncbi:MAG: GNAT family N-acetyltransferase [Bacteroidetes bacterium]|nr:GNAT family N-acetyltransferase [Bacteroidota bacterium]